MLLVFLEIIGLAVVLTCLAIGVTNVLARLSDDKPRTRRTTKKGK